MRTLVSLFGQQAASWMRTSLLGVASASQAPAAPRDWYDVLATYYHANGAYQVLRDAGVAAGLSGEALRGIKNPAYRAVEFYAAHLWPGALPDALPIVTENARIVAPIQQVWTWSNWSAQKQTAARRLALYGDWFVKVNASVEARRVWLQQLDPRTVTDFERDERGVVTFARLDVPQIETDSAGRVTERWVHVEAWSAERGSYRQWRARENATLLPLEQLGPPAIEEPLAAFGIDFVPIVHAPFRDVGDTRGVGCFVPVLDKIDEVNRLATRLHQMAFRNLRNIWATTRTGTDASGRPLPGVDLGRKLADGTTAGTIKAISDETFIDLPGATDLKSLVPDLNYEALLAIVREQLAEIEADLPEIRWYRLTEQANLSGRALRLLLAPAAKRVEEARGNAETALVRANQIALTMGAALGLWDVGRYEAGDFMHTFAGRDVFPLTDLDEAEAHRARAQAAQAYATAGLPLGTILTDVLDKTEEQAAEILTLAAETMTAETAMSRAPLFDEREPEE